MKLRAPIPVFVLLCCLTQQKLVVAACQDQQPETTAGSQAATTKSGAADGEPSPALTGGGPSPTLNGVRRPLYRLRKSDVMDIDFAFSPQLNQTVTVQPDGFIPLKGIDPLYAEGSTVPQLQELIRTAYTGVLHDPVATVLLKDFDKPYFIAAGEVGHPGKYELRSDTTVTEAVAIAGGFTPRSKHSQVVLFRRVSDDRFESHLLDVKALLKARTLKEDMHMRAGDLLFVPQNTMSKIRQFLPASSLGLYANQF
jgi:polysaccharide export outer membrane protein